MSRSYSKKFREVLFGAIILLAALLMIGCSGDDGDTGAAGPAGPEGPAGPAGPPSGAAVDLSTMTAEQQSELGTVSMKTGSISVAIDSPPEVTFTLVDDLSRPVLGLDSIAANIYDNIIRFTLAKLVAGSDGNPDYWHSYVVNNTGTPTYDSPNHGGILTANGDNTYTYTFAADVGNNPAYDPTATHRLAGQIGGGDTGFEPSNFVFDFVPSGGAVTHTRDIVMTASCNECHDPLSIHGRRREIGYCVTCHNPGLADGEGNLAFMVHKIHDAGEFETLDDAVSYAEVTYPQDLRNCRKCHDGADAATPQGNNWRTVQNRSQCFLACHSVPDRVLEKAAFHTSILGDCASCHNNEIVAVLNIDRLHTTANATANNPGLLPGQRDIDYKIDRAALQSGSLVITFRILSNGTALNPKNLPASLSGSPSFLFAYAQPQDGIATPADFNNLGRAAGQPQSISVANLANGSAGTLTFSGSTCTATLPNPFPAGATLRTVGLQGYYTQNVSGENVALHTQSAVVTVAGNAQRRLIADGAGCAACHEIFEGHGGNRVFTADGGVTICTMCHNPNLSSSGRTIENPSATLTAALGNDPLDYPEATNNFKDMIHGIHAADFRSETYEFVRGGSHSGYYDWSEVTFPGDLTNCTKCHLGDSYLPGEVPEKALLTTSRTTGVASGMDANFADAADARYTVPNLTDWVITPVAGACFACHDSLAAMGHMEQNGAAIDWTRASVNTVDTCAICHGPGNIADVAKAHDLLD